VPCTIIYIAIAIINTDITPPEMPRKARLPVRLIVFFPKVVNIVDSRVNIDTHAAARLIDFDAVYTGLLYLRYLTIFTTATVNDAKVYAANAMVVIS
jgi:hypothetical protein